MKFKKTLTGMALAISTAILPQTTKATTESSTNTAAKVSQQKKAETIQLPKWVAVDKNGNFDRGKAEKQATLLWKEHGKDIQKFAADIRAGVPEDVAYAQYAHRLAAGDKEKEQQILSLFDAVKEVYGKRNGKMDDGLMEKYRGSVMITGILAALALMSLAAGRAEAEDVKLKDVATALIVGGTATFAVSAPIEAALNHFDKFDNVGPKETFVQIQQAAYDAYQQQKVEGKDYSVVDMSTAKKMAEMKQAKR